MAGPRASTALTVRPFVVFVVLALVVIGGWMSFRAMPVGLLPDLDYPLINVITRYPAGTARDTELLLTRPIEAAMHGLLKVKRIRSLSAPGVSQVTVEFLWGVDAATARQQVSAALSSIAATLPAGAAPEIENIGSSLSMISTYTLSGPADPVTMRSWADYVAAPALRRQPGVSRVQVMGGGVDALRIDLDPVRLRRHDISADDVVAAIRAANVLATAGTIARHGRDLLVSLRGQIHDVSALRHVLLRRGDDGAPVTLGDVADLYPGSVPVRYAIASDRHPAVALMIQKQPGASTLAVSAAVDAALTHLTPPTGISVRKFYDQSEIIGLAYRNMRNQLLAGAAIALAVLFLALGRSRVTFVLAATIPLSVVAAFMVMRWFGLGVNLMTLGALTVTVGMVVDDSILVLENISRHREMGKTRTTAALDGTREIFAADVTGTLVVLAAFVPLVLLGGLAGHLFDPFAVTFGGVLALSLVVSLTLIPWAAARWLPASDATNYTAETDSRGGFFGSMIRHNGAFLGWALRHRRLTILISLLSVTGTSALLVFNPVRFLPLLDENSLLLSYQLAPGTSLTESNRVGDTLEALALHQPGVSHVFRRTGSPGKTYFMEGPEAGELVLRLKGDGTRSAEAVRAALANKIATMPGILTRINEPTSEKIEESLSGLPGLFAVTLLGDDLGALHRAAARVADVAATVPGIASVVNNNRVPIDALDVEIDRDACARLGVTPQAIARTLHLAVQGENVATSVVDGRVRHLFVRYAGAARRRPADLDAILVTASDGTKVALRQVAHVVPVSAYATIEHQFGSRALSLAVDIGGNPISALHGLSAAIGRLHLPAGIRVVFAGEYRELIHTAGQLGLILLGSALLVYGLMVVQFGNLLDPAVILVKLPIDFMGAAFALFVTHQELDLTVMIGFVALIGVSVNNGIVLLSFVKSLRAEGLGAIDAVQKAVAVRMRPMLLTQITAVIGLLPASVGLGSGPQLLQPLAIMLFGGLTAGAFLTLNLVPVLYVATDRFRRLPGAPSSSSDG